jgi:hypothetical protein
MVPEGGCCLLFVEETEMLKDDFKIIFNTYLKSLGGKRFQMLTSSILIFGFHFILSNTLNKLNTKLISAQPMTEVSYKLWNIQTNMFSLNAPTAKIMFTNMAKANFLLGDHYSRCSCAVITVMAYAFKHDF